MFSGCITISQTLCLAFKIYQYEYNFCTTVYKLCRNAKLPNNASTIIPMPDCFVTALKIHIDDVLKYIVKILYMKHSIESN